MADSNFPAVGLEVDLDGFATLDRQVDRGVEAYKRLGKAARDATKADAGDIDAVAARKVRAAESATKAQELSARQILAAQRGLTNFFAQQDAQILRSRQNLWRQQANEAEKGAKALASAAEKTARAQINADRLALTEFRKTIDQRVAAGRKAGEDQQRIDRQTYELRRRLTAQQAAEAARQAKAWANIGTAAPIQAGNLFQGASSAIAKFMQPFQGLRQGLAQTRAALFDVRTAVGVFLGGLVVGPIVHFMDAMVALEARIGFFAEKQKDVPYLFEAVYQAAQRSRSPLEALGTLYTRLAPLASQLGKSQRELLRISETVQKGIIIGGATPEEAKSSSQQLAQALASNRLGGDELRSLAENAPLLLGAIAKELNMNTGQFIKWAQAGKANAAVVVGALEKAAPRIDKLFSQFPVTISQGITVVTNAFEKFIGEVNRSTKIGETVGASLVNFSTFLSSTDTINATVKALQFLGDVFHGIGVAADFLIKSLPVVAVGMALVTVRAIVMSKAVQGAAYGFALMSAAAGRSAAATAVASNIIAGSAAKMAGALRGALSFFGGPVGVAILATAAALTYFANAQKNAAKAAENLQDSQSGAINALDRAIAFTDAYGVSNTGLTKSLNEVISSSGDAAKKALEGVDANDKAAVAAVQRAERERLLTVSILRRAAADAQARGAEAQGAGKALDQKSFGVGLLTAIGTQDLSMAQQAELEDKQKSGRNQAFNAATAEYKLAQKLYNAAKDVSTAKLDLSTPAAKGSGVGTNPPSKQKKTEEERRAEALRRESEATIATTNANLALAKAYDISDAAALNQMAAVEASGKAIRRQGDVEDFVARQAALNTSKAVADSAKRVADLKFQAEAQAKANNSVRSGLQNSVQANEQLEIEAQLRPDIAQAQAAQLAADQALAAGQKESAAAALEAKGILVRKIIEEAFARQKVNEELRKADLLQQQTNQSDELELIAKRNELLGTSARNQAVVIAGLEKEQELRSKNQLNTPEAPGLIQGAKDVAGKNFDLGHMNDDLQNQSDLLGQIADQASSAGQSLVSAFGDGASALANLLEVATSYDAKQAEFDARRADAARNFGKDSKEVALIDRQSSAARIKNYGDLANAAQGLFKKQSAGYKLLGAAEQAFRLYEFAMAAKSVVVKTAETAAKIGLFGAQAQAAAAAGAANMFATLGPGGFVAVAAMVAVLAGLGLSLSGGGGAVPGANDSENRQKAQGSGSVLGDASAKSNSLANSLEIIAQNTNKDLEFSNGMLKALRSIDSQMSRVAAGLARTLGAGGSLDTSKFGLGTTTSNGGLLSRGIGAVGGAALGVAGGLATGSLLGAVGLGGAGALGGLGIGLQLGSIAGPIGAIVGAILGPMLFKSKTTTSIQDQGLQFGSQDLGSILSNGIQGQTYAQILATTKKSFLGINYSTKNTSSTVNGGLDEDFQKQVTQLIGSLRGAVLAGADVLGVQGAAAVLDAFQVNLGKLSFKDMNSQEIEDALNNIFSKLGDDLAVAAVPVIASLQKVGEGALETLTRVVRDYQVLDISLASIGKTFGAVGISSLEARERLIDLAGGIDALAEQTSYFAENFLSDLEQITPVQKAVTAELARLGLQGVTTKDQFKNIVLGLDLTTQAGQDTYAALLALAPAFSKVVDFATAGSQAVQKARDELQKAYDAEAGALNTAIDKWNKLADTLKAFGDTLDAGPLSGNNIFQNYDATKRTFLSTAASAATGNETALGNIPSTGQAFLEASKVTARTLVDYLLDVATVRNATRAGEAAAKNQATIAQQQLDALNASVNGLITLNTSVLTVAQAIVNLQAALAAQGQALAPTTPVVTQPTTTTPVVTQPTTTQVTDYNAYLSQNPDVLAEYQRNLSSSKGRAYLSQLGISSAEDFARYHYETFGQSEGRSLPMTSVPLVRSSSDATTLGGATNDNSLQQGIAALNDRVDDLISATEAVAQNTGGSYRLYKAWDGNGLPETRDLSVSAP